MISEINFPGLSESETFAYAAKLDFFKDRTGVKLGPGLNILFGKNGSGKSTVLRMAGLMLAAEQGGVSTVTHSWLGDIFGYGADNSKVKGIEIVHDGQPIMYGNPRNAVGLFGGGAAFDDDFMSEGLANRQSRDSTGYTTLRRLNRMLAATQGRDAFPKKIDNRIGTSRPSDKRVAAALAMLKGSIPEGPRTLIFDEPESGVGIAPQANLFDLLARAAQDGKFQIIIATHSPFCLGFPGVNYIEMSPGYMENCENAIAHLQRRFEIRDLLAKFEEAKSATATADPVDEEKPVATEKPKRKRKTS